MNYSDINFSDGVCAVVQTKNGTYTVADINANGGGCDCCTAFKESDVIAVLKVVNVKTMNVLYEHKEPI